MSWPWEQIALAIPTVRIAWRRYRGHVYQRCRSCGGEFREGWKLQGRDVENPYLCANCWRSGDGVALD